METHPAVGESASAPNTTTHDAKVESCAVNEDERTFESQSTTTTTTTATTATVTEEEDGGEEEGEARPVEGHSLAFNNASLNTGDDDETHDESSSTVAPTDDQQLLQLGDSNSISGSGSSNNDNNNNDNVSDNIKYDDNNNSLSDRHNDHVADIDPQHENENQTEAQEQARMVVEQSGLDDESKVDSDEEDGDNGHVLEDHNVSQDEHAPVAALADPSPLPTLSQPSDKASVEEEVEDGSDTREGKRSCVSAGDDQGEQSGACIDEGVDDKGQADNLSPSGSHEEETRPHVDDRSLSSLSAQVSATPQQQQEEQDDGQGTITPRTHVEGELIESANVIFNGDIGRQDAHYDHSTPEIRLDNGGTAVAESSHEGSDDRANDSAATAELRHENVDGGIDQVTPREDHDVTDNDAIERGGSSMAHNEELDQEEHNDEVDTTLQHHMEEERQVNTESPPQLEQEEGRRAVAEGSHDTNVDQEQANLTVPVVNGTTQQQQQQEPIADHLIEHQRHHNNANTNHNRDDDASDHTVHNAPRSRRVWEADRQASECRRCNRRFNFLVRRHHCRRCGLVVCDRCSSHRIRLPPEEIIQDPAIDPSHYPLIAMHPQRVCDVCNRLPIKEAPSSSSSPRRRATAPVAMNHMKRSPSSQSLMTECPVCGTDLLGMQKEDQEKHLQLCLNTGSPPVRPPRYLVYEISENSPQIDYECPICFEEFKAGEKIARMICLCSYHRHCLSDWLERGKGCPVHYDATISA